MNLLIHLPHCRGDIWTLDGTNLAFITPIFKGGDKNNPANYRPVALTNHITETLERLIKVKIVEHLTANQLYNET